MGIVLGPNRYGKAESRVVRIVRDTARDNYRFSALVLGIVRSAPFQMRKAG